MSKNKLIILISSLVLITIAVLGILVLKVESKKRIAFENKVKCEQYTNQVKEKVNSENSPNSSVILKSVFYSPIENSCLFVKEWTITTSDGNSATTTIIADVLTGSTIRSFVAPYQEDYQKFFVDRELN